MAEKSMIVSFKRFKVGKAVEISKEILNGRDYHGENPLNKLQPEIAFHPPDCELLHLPRRELRHGDPRLPDRAL